MKLTHEEKRKRIAAKWLARIANEYISGEPFVMPADLTLRANLMLRELDSVQIKGAKRPRPKESE